MNGGGEVDESDMIPDQVVFADGPDVNLVPTHPSHMEAHFW